MTFYVSTIAFLENGKPVFESLSELDGKIMAWDEAVFASLLAIGQKGDVVWVADEPGDLSRIGESLTSPSICLMEMKFFEEMFEKKVVIAGE